METSKNIGNQVNKQQEVNQKNLLLATFLNLFISVAEVIGGILSNSLALLSDAFHNLGDTFATFIAYIAVRVSARKSSERRTYGFKRIEIIAALLNSLILIGLSFYLFHEAWVRFNNPESINSVILLVVAMIGLLANVYAMLLLKNDAKKSLNVKAAYLHLIGDSLSSVLVIVGGIIIHFYNILWIDPLVTFLIGAYILKETLAILRRTIGILMHIVPSTLDLIKLKNEVEKFEEVSNIHHIHAWNLTDRQLFFEGHIDTVKDFKLSELNPLRLKIENLLKSQFEIDHITLQFEYQNQDKKDFIKQNE